MSKKKEKNPVQETPVVPEEEILEEQTGEAKAAEAETDAQAETPGGEPEETPGQVKDPVQEQLEQQQERFLRLAAEYDNYRKRTAKEKESLWTDAKADTVQAFLPVYGVEMTMNQLKEVFAKLGVTEIEAQGKPFDPNLHNAVMHIEDDNLEENVVAQVFQAGFMLGEKVIRFAMVQVAN